MGALLMVSIATFFGGATPLRIPPTSISTMRRRPTEIVSPLLGGIGVDYLLTARSSPKEVADATREIIKACAPGGRFLLAPVYAHSEMDMEKVKVMLETAWEYGKYPIAL